MTYPKINRIEISEIIEQCINQTDIKNGQILFISGDGGNGKTTILESCIEKYNASHNIFPIIDLNNPYYWNTNNILTRQCEVAELKIKNTNNNYAILKNLKNSLSKTSKSNIILYDTAEEIKTTSKVYQFLNIIKNIKNTFIIVAGRPSSKLFSVNESSDYSIQNPILKYELKGYSLDETKSILEKNNIKLDSIQIKNIHHYCSSSSKGESKKYLSNPLYLSLSCEILKPHSASDSDHLLKILSEDTTALAKSLGSPVAFYKNELLKNYINDKTPEGRVALWLSIVRYPISAALWKKLNPIFESSSEDIGSKKINKTANESPGIVNHWDTLTTKPWIRNTTGSGLSLHDELAYQVSVRGIQKGCFDDFNRQEIISEGMLPAIIYAAKSVTSSNAGNDADQLLVSSLSIISNPEKEIDKLLNTIESLISSNIALAEIHTLNLLDLVGNTKSPHLVAFHAYGFTKKIQEEFIKSPNRIISLSNILVTLNTKKIIPYDILLEYYKDFRKSRELTKKNLAALLKNTSFSAVESRVLNDKTEKLLQKTCRAYLNIGDFDMVSRTYGVLGFFYRLSKHYELSRKSYISAIQNTFNADTQQISTLITIFKNFSAVEAYSTNSNDALFMIGVAYDLTQRSNLKPSFIRKVISQRSEVSKCLHNYSEAYRYIKLATEKADEGYNQILLDFRSIRLKYFRRQEKDVVYSMEDVSRDVETIELRATDIRPDLLPDILNFKGKVLIDSSSSNYIEKAESCFIEGVNVSSLYGNYEFILANTVSLSALSIIKYETGNLIEREYLLSNIEELLLQKEAIQVKDYYYQLLLHKAHWLLIEHMESNDVEAFDRALEIYSSCALKILRGQAGSAGAYGTPAGYYYWFKIVSIIYTKDLNLYNKIIENLTNQFSQLSNLTTHEGVDYRGALISIPFSFESKLGKFNSFDSDIESDANIKLRSVTLVERCKALYSVGKWEECRAHCIDCICQSFTSSTTAERGYAQLLLGFLEIIEGNLHDSLTLAKFGIDDIQQAFALNTISPTELSECYRLHAEIYRYSHNYTEAWKSYCKAKDHSSQSSFEYLHLIQEMAICAYFAYVEGDVLYSGISSDKRISDQKLLEVSKSLISEATKTISSYFNDYKIQRLLPMALIRRGIIFSDNDQDNSLKDYHDGFLKACATGNQKSILLASILLTQSNLNKYILASHQNKLIADDEISYPLDLNTTAELCEPECQDPVKKITNYPSLRAQYLLGYSILLLLRNINNGAEEKSEIITFSNKLIYLAPLVFGSGLSSIGRSGRPLGYDVWVEALRTLDKSTLKSIVTHFHRSWDYSNTKVSGSAWAFITSIYI